MESFCICLDCDSTSTMNEHGECITCKSKSTMKQGAIKILRSLLQIDDMQHDLSGLTPDKLANYATPGDNQ